METDRLHLKLITEADAEFLYHLMNTSKWHQMIGDRGVHSAADARQYMEERMSPILGLKGFVNHVMFEKETGNPVGTCSLHDREGVKGLDIGYALLSTHEGKGYASEGARAMIQLAFEKYQLDSVSAITNDENIGSYRVLEKLGFVQDGYIRLPDSSEDIRLYVLKKSDWIQSKR